MGPLFLYLLEKQIPMDVSAKFLASDLHAFLGLTSSTQQVGVKKRALNTSAFKAL